MTGVCELGPFRRAGAIQRAVQSDDITLCFTAQSRTIFGRLRSGNCPYKAELGRSGYSSRPRSAGWLGCGRHRDLDCHRVCEGKGNQAGAKNCEEYARPNFGQANLAPAKGKLTCAALSPTLTGRAEEKAITKINQ